MHTVELPARIEAREPAATLDEILGTVKIVYTAAACGPCGRASLFYELTDPVVRGQIAA
ncbi:MAG TPA: hypothetical protein VGL99_05580 [Chloroflexota bacterium]|jgi:hypothetical protein